MLELDRAGREVNLHRLRTGRPAKRVGQPRAERSLERETDPLCITDEADEKIACLATDSELPETAGVGFLIEECDDRIVPGLPLLLHEKFRGTFQKDPDRIVPEKVSVA